jgi:hypothetical protein
MEIGGEKILQKLWSSVTSGILERLLYQNTRIDKIAICIKGCCYLQELFSAKVVYKIKNNNNVYGKLLLELGEKEYQSYIKILN